MVLLLHHCGKTPFGKFSFKSEYVEKYYNFHELYFFQALYTGASSILYLDNPGSHGDLAMN